jgi:hypothetical protein
MQSEKTKLTKNYAIARIVERFEHAKIRGYSGPTDLAKLLGTI